MISIKVNRGLKLTRWISTSQIKKSMPSIYNPGVSETIKENVLKSLSSSKNERLAFSAIWNISNQGTKSKIIRDKDFREFGLLYRNRRNEAVLRLIKKGLIFRVKEDMSLINGDAQLYRYSIKKWGCVRFYEFQNTQCSKCIKLIKA